MDETEGTVTGIPEDAAPGDEVTAVASPAAGYEFVGWFLKGGTEVISKDPSYTFTIAADQILEARFEKKKYTVKVTAQTGGTVTSSADEAFYQDTVTVTAAPGKEYLFDGWYEGNALVSNAAVYTFVIEKDRTLTAKFNKKQTAGSGEEGETEVKTEAPKGVKAKSVKKGIQISWKTANGADGYIIYRSYKKKKGYKKIAEIKKAGTKKYLDKKAKKGKTAYYKIKSYKTIKGKQVLSSTFSKVVKKKR